MWFTAAIPPLSIAWYLVRSGASSIYTTCPSFFFAAHNFIILLTATQSTRSDACLWSPPLPTGWTPASARPQRDRQIR
ncbi:hypothetical protein A4X03_0g9902 [Tilletia caries]|uniref:Uncharacterized protein n=1 Tax=Tilletia caries TaxID=13290 RepID=A0A8T8S8L4_9BASI|nr:hypothetical protein A4X03_0g9902 [Tilletia caries]